MIPGSLPNAEAGSGSTDSDVHSVSKERSPPNPATGPPQEAHYVSGPERMWPQGSSELSVTVSVGEDAITSSVWKCRRQGGEYYHKSSDQPRRSGE
jgi:hypothetical protein